MCQLWSKFVSEQTCFFGAGHCLFSNRFDVDDIGTCVAIYHDGRG